VSSSERKSKKRANSTAVKSVTANAGLTLSMKWNAMATRTPCFRVAGIASRIGIIVSVAMTLTIQTGSSGSFPVCPKLAAPAIAVAQLVTGSRKVTFHFASAAAE
jgi:hypothetical protein